MDKPIGECKHSYMKPVLDDGVKLHLICGKCGRIGSVEKRRVSLGLIEYFTQVRKP